ncbi:MAG: hypothetical protein QOG52_2137, partial [Frankiaceae bacterium]|nr:hypothetical protein [Frankiaceae bacterium]
FMNTVAGRDGGPTYLIISRQMEIYDTYFGILPPGALQNLRARVEKDPQWQVVFSSTEFVVFLSQPGVGSP